MTWKSERGRTESKAQTEIDAAARREMTERVFERSRFAERDSDLNVRIALRLAVHPPPWNGMTVTEQAQRQRDGHVAIRPAGICDIR